MLTLSAVTSLDFDIKAGLVVTLWHVMLAIVDSDMAAGEAAVLIDCDSEPATLVFVKSCAVDDLGDLRASKAASGDSDGKAVMLVRLLDFRRVMLAMVGEDKVAIEAAMTDFDPEVTLLVPDL